MPRLSGWEILIIIIVLVLVFGAAKLPAIASSVGKSMKVFKKEVRELRDDDEKPAVTNYEATGGTPPAHNDASSNKTSPVDPLRSPTDQPGEQNAGPFKQD